MNTCGTCKHFEPSCHDDGQVGWCNKTSAPTKASFGCLCMYDPAVTYDCTKNIKRDVVSDTISERAKIYGDPATSHTNIGLAWTAILQQHYGITLDHAIPNHVVALMMVVFKANRSARIFHADNFVDLQAYAKFAREFQEKKDK